MKCPPVLDVWLQLSKSSGFNYAMVSIAELVYSKDKAWSDVDWLLRDWINEEDSVNRYKFCIDEIIKYFGKKDDEE